MFFNNSNNTCSNCYTDTVNWQTYVSVTASLVCCIAVLEGSPERKVWSETVEPHRHWNATGRVTGELSGVYINPLSGRFPVCECVCALCSPWTITLWACVYPLASTSCPAQSQRLFTQHWQASANAAARDRTALQLPQPPEIPYPKHTSLNFCESSERPHIRCYLPRVSEITNFRLGRVKEKREKFIEKGSTLMLFSFRLIIPLIQLISVLLTHR